MPSPVGHMIAGLAVAWVAAPVTPASATFRHASDWRRWFDPLVVACGVLAAAPDLDLMLSGAHRTVSHSLLAVALVAAAAALMARQARSPAAGRAALLCGLAYGSHLVLDWLGTDRLNPPFGLQLFWPLERWYISGWDVFRSTERRQIFSAATIAYNARTLGQELVLLGPLLAAAWWWRRRRLRAIDDATGRPGLTPSVRPSPTSALQADD